MILNAKIWQFVEQTKSGMKFRSVITDQPMNWKLKTVSGLLVRYCGEYEITRRERGNGFWTYQLTRNGYVLEIADYRSLAAAKQHAQQNARGEDVRYVR